MDSSAQPRFTVDGSPELEAHLASVCLQVLDGVRAIIPSRQLEGVVLGGGYGRGEGGVLRTAEGDRPYNDLEFYVLMQGPAVLAERRFRVPLAELGHRLSPGAALEVEFKVMTRSKLRQSAPSMFYYDLVSGHRWLLGDDRLFTGCAHHHDPSRIPLHEATRLLMNRCSGLLFSAERLQREGFGPEESDYVGRNLAKAELALGDVVLAAHGQYHWSCRVRHERLQQLRLAENWREEVLARHATGVEFKLHPIRPTDSREVLAARHRALKELAWHVWLWLEQRRLGQSFHSPADYVGSRLNLCPDTSPWKNIVLNARAFGPHGLLSPRVMRYPRERLLRALCALLWDRREESASTDLARNLLNAAASDFPDMVQAYQRLWERYN